MHLDYLYLCIVNEDEKFAPPREKFFSPMGEVKKSFELAWMTFGLDKEDGSERCKTQEVRGKDVRRHSELKNLDSLHPLDQNL